MTLSKLTRHVSPEGKPQPSVAPSQNYWQPSLPTWSGAPGYWSPAASAWAQGSSKMISLVKNVKYHHVFIMPL